MVLMVSAAKSLYSASDDVVILTAANFDKLVKNSDDVWMIEFYAPWCGHCKTLAPEFKKAAKALKGVVKVGALDADAHGQVGSAYGVRGFPTLKFFTGKGSKPVDYNGGRTASDIVNFSMDKAKQVVKERLSGKKSSGQQQKKNFTGGKKGTVLELNESEFTSQILNTQKAAMVLFYAPWCGHCKKAMPEWQNAAGEAENTVFVKVNCDEERNLCQQYGVQGYPTIKFFGGGKVEDFNGARSASSFVSFADKQSENLVPPRELAEMVDQAVFDNYCVEHVGVCLIAFLPHIKDSGEEKRQQLVKELKAIRDKHKTKPVTFMWVQGGNNFDLEEKLRLGSGFPSLVAINHGKKKFSPMRAKYNSNEINKFINNLLSGRTDIYDIRGELPKIKKKKVKKTAQQTDEL